MASSAKRRGAPQAPDNNSGSAMIPLLIRAPRSLIEALDAQCEHSGLSRAVLARTLLQQGLASGGEIAALREVLEFAGRRGLSSERLAAMLGETKEGRVILGLPSDWHDHTPDRGP